MRFHKVLPTALVLALLSGCMSNSPGDTKDLSKYNAGPVKVQSDSQSTTDLTEGRHIVPIRTINNAPYASLGDLTEATGYHGAWLDNGKFGVGDNDPAWTFQTGERTVMLAGKAVTMPGPAVSEGNQLYIPVSGLQSLFGDVTVFVIEPDNVAFFPKPAPETGVDGKSLDFADDKPSKLSMAMAGNNVDEVQMISFARKYLGVPYDFGAAPYKQSHRFDCSTFTQHVFGEFGVDLPRLARQQASKGNFVDRTKLQHGDLLFFYVPGRFKSNETVGHVGIYMGDGNMIHSSPKPEDGVQITPINKTYWKDTFLYAKRLT
ncbi:C40 family peptidase [Cohnella sp.]|uniref:C40 family peptidase n=1 Tax=Cohnella sp. TaxID=1883426 RepID=UPI003562E553